jgi:hypothetical protein
MLHRPESGLGLFFFIGIGMLFFFGIQSWVLINRWKYPFISLLILLGIFYLDWQKTTYFERKIEPDIEYALTTQRVLDISEMMTYEDSLKFQMTRYGIFIDDEFVSLDYLKRITSVAYNFNPPKFKKSLATILDFGSYYVYFPVFLFVVLLFPLINRRWLLVLSIVLLNTVYFLLYAYIEYNTDISNRHLSPFLVLQVLLNILLLFKYHKIQGLQSFAFLFSMFILLIFAWRTLQNYSTKYNILHQEVSCLEKTMESIEKQYQNQIVVISLFNYRLLDHPFSFYTNNYKANTYILYDLSYYSLVPPNEQYLAKLCACDPENPLEFFTWLQEVNGLYVSVEPRFELIENYMNFNHGVDFKFVQFDQDLKLIKPACILNSQQGEFEMKRIFMSK